MTLTETVEAVLKSLETLPLPEGGTLEGRVRWILDTDGSPYSSASLIAPIVEAVQQRLNEGA